MNDDATHANNVTRSVRRLIIALSVIVFGGAFLFTIWGGMGTARNAAERVRCQQILKSLFAAIEADIQRPHSELDRGGISSRLRNLVVKPGDHSPIHSGPNRSVADAYAFSPNLDAASSDDPPLRVLVCDKPGNHVMHLANGLRERRDGKIQEQALLLFSNGSVAVWVGDSHEYKKWVADFVNGKGSPFPPGMEERVLDYAHRVEPRNVTEQTDEREPE